MAIKYYTGIDLNNNELKNVQIQNCLTGEYPASPVEGQIIYDSTAHLLKVYKGSAWSSVGEPLTGDGKTVSVSNGQVGLNDTYVSQSQFLFIDGNGNLASSVPEINCFSIQPGCSIVLTGCDISMSTDDDTTVYSALCGLQCTGCAHISDTDNPHQVSAGQLCGGTLCTDVTAVTPTDDSPGCAIATKEYVINKFGDLDALTYKGTVSGGSTGEYGAFTPAANKGDVYKVSAAGKIDGIKVEVGDMLICNTDGTAAATSSNYTTIAGKWDFVQVNIDGAVIGPSSSVDGRVAVFDGATGKLIKDSGHSLSEYQPAATAVKYQGSPCAVGCATQGVYVDANGNVVAMTHSLGCDVPATAAFGDYVACVEFDSSCGNAITGFYKNGNTLCFSLGEFVSPCEISEMVTHNGQVGSTINPVYVGSDGWVCALSYTIQSSVPANAVFTDHITTIGTSCGEGNVVTGLSADSNGVITPTYGISLDMDKVVSYPGCGQGVGNSTTPVYIGTNGAATALSYTIGKSVPSDAVFTDTVTAIASTTGSGNVVSGITASGGQLTVAKTSIPVVSTSTGTIAAAAKTTTVQVTGTYLSSYAKDSSGNIVMVSVSVTVSNGTTSVKFDCASEPGVALTCVVVYI